MKISKEELREVKFAVTRMMYLWEQIKKACADSPIPFCFPEMINLPFINEFKGIEMIRLAFEMPESAYEIEYTSTGAMFIYLKVLNVRFECILQSYDDCYIPQEDNNTVKKLLEKLEESKDA